MEMKKATNTKESHISRKIKERRGNRRKGSSNKGKENKDNGSSDILDIYIYIIKDCHDGQ